MKRRTRTLTELFHSYRPYDHLVGRRQRVLVTEISHDRQYFVGHNKAYQQVSSRGGVAGLPAGQRWRGEGSLPVTVMFFLEKDVKGG